MEDHPVASAPVSILPLFPEFPEFMYAMYVCMYVELLQHINMAKLCQLDPHQMLRGIK